MRFLVGYVLVAVCLLSLAQAQRLRGRITSRTFSRDMTEVPPGAATLAFVFDVTGSMWDDLKQVIAGARQILTTTLNRQEKPLYDYVLIPFHDPVVGPITVTTDGNKFQRGLKNLYVHGGGDCPEMSLTAIREALEISLPSSFIYVFTDASAKDYFRLREVLQIIQRKQSQVVFVLTGDCNKRDSEGYKAYEKIAATSSGQVFFITKSDVSEVVKFIEVSVQAHKVVLHASDHVHPGDRTWKIPFDPELQEVTLSLSGPDRRIRLFNPQGREVTQRDGLQTLLELGSVLILNIKNATAGNWRVSAYSSGAHSFRVTGLSTLDFQARFSRKATLDWSRADYQPVEGADAYVLLNATGLPPPGEFRNMILRDTEGITMRNIPLDPPPDLDQPTLYTARPFPTPRQDFYIYVSGVTHEGFPFTRATKNAILKIIPGPPIVRVSPTHDAYFDYPAEIPCEVTSLLPYNVTWSRQLPSGWQRLSKSSHEESTTVYHRIAEITDDAEGMYECYVINSRGHDSGKTFLDVEERPPSITVDGDVIIEPGGRGILTCHVNSKITYIVTWSRTDGTLLDRSRTRLLSNYSLIISRARPEDEAEYRCTATNKGGSSHEDINVIVQSEPRVNVYPSEPISFTANMTFSLRCSVHGYPDPTIVWLKGEEVVRRSKNINIRRRNTELRFTKAQQEQEGVYTCQATNKAGSDSAAGRLIFNESPTARLDEDQLILEGQSTEFQCHVTGVPRPRVVWYRGENQLASSSRYQISEEAGTLTISGLLTTDTGEYTCIAQNNVGRSSDTIFLQVGTIPVIVRPPTDTGIDIDRGSYLPCDARGFPAPSITWLKHEERVETGSDGEIVGIFELVIGQDDSRVYHELPSNNLVIRDMGLEDVGDYTCTATNQFGSDSETARVDVTGLIRPVITVSDDHPHVIVGQSISIPCRITSGNPDPTREWQREDEVFQPRGRISVSREGSVVVTSARVSDAGEYVCIATNIAGQFDATIDLDVWVPPTITTPESEYKTIEERVVYLECEATGNPPPTVQWTKVGIRGPLRYLPDYSVLSDHRLAIRNPKAEHTGEYTCIASNAAGRASVDASLVVYYKPRTKDGSLDTYTVIQGDSIKLDCPVTESNPPPTFKWFFNGAEIIHITGRYEMSDDGKLTITSAQVKDDGQYTCTAVNEAGSVSHRMSLVVYVPPRILRGPSVIRGLEGEDINFKCEATGIPLPTIKWRRNDLEVVETPRLTITESQNEFSASSSVTIQPSRLSDDGEFVCVAVNIAGKATATTTLDVQQRPTIERNNFDKDLTPSRGSQLSIPCVAHGDPNPTIRWFHNGQELTGDEFDVDIASNGSLILYSVESEDSGMYRCEAENPLGKVDIEARVTVYEPPEIEGGSETTKFWVYEGDPATMYCYADAVPKPEIKWYKVERNSDRLLKEERNRIKILSDGDILNITRSKVSDTGRYYCAAVNVEGTSYKFYELDVYVIPSIDGGDETGRSKVVLGDDFTLNCPVSGIPFPRIRWFKGLREISVEDEGMLIDNRGQTLTVIDSELIHDGEYSCVADNQVGDASKLFDVSILVPPEITGGNMVHTIQVTRYLALECRASGIPKPTLSWYKDEKAVAISNDDDLLDGPQTLENGRYLEFASIRVEDEGVYKCVAVNEAGSDNRNHTVNVQVPPQLGDHDAPSNISVVKGEDVTLTCHATGDPPPVITWLKNGVVVRTGGRFSISDHGTYLTIRDALESDRGKYTCQARNDVGVVTQNQYLDVLVGPDIGGADEETITAEKGDTVALDCVVSGNPTPRIRWEKNGRPIAENEHYRFAYEGQRLVISNVDETDTSQYTCTASNIIDDDAKSFRLDVHVPPEISPFKKDIYEVVESDKIAITCVATGIPTPEISWFKDDQAIAKSRFFKFRDDGRQLVILKADVAVHDGRYTCRATNIVGEDEKDISVSVLIPPSIYGQEIITNKRVKEGNEVELECKVKTGKPVPTVRWFRGHDDLISRLSTVWNHDVVEETLTNIRTHVDNTGAYWCEASNIAGRARKNFTIDVHVTPFIEGDETENRHVILGNDISFPCEVSGVPMPDITWAKDGNPISELQAEKYVQTEQEFGLFYLTVKNAQEEDRGRYSCIANNPAGSDSKDVNLDVYLPPSHDGSGIDNVTALENEDVFLECDIVAFPRPTIRWYKDGRPVVITREMEERREGDWILPIPRAQISDSGIYRCEAENVAGTAGKAFRLKVHSRPKVFGPLVDEITKLVGDQIDMLCDIRGVPPPTLSWTKNGHPFEVDESKMMLLSGSKVLRIYHAELADTGQFECHGTNEEGTATKSFDVTVHESSRIHGSPHETHDVNKGENFVLECFVSGTPRPTIRWFKDGKEVLDGFRTLISEGGRYLAVSDTHEKDEGHYICNASNVEAYDTKAYTVNVRVPPTIEDGPDRLWVKEGDNIILMCDVQSNSPVEIRWSLNGAPIIPSANARPSPQGKRLQLFNVQREKAGQYTCTATNAAGVAERNTALDVYIKPVIADGDVTDTYNVTRTESVTLECDVVGFPEPKIEWSKDFYPIAFDEEGRAQRGNYEIDESGRLFTLFKAEVHDEGIYKCHATNDAGYASKNYKVNVFVPPEIYRDGLTDEITARERSFIRIQCAASGLPTPTIRWLKNGDTFESSDTITITNHFEDHHSFLAFKSIAEADAATYTCLAENPAGQDLFDIDITVNVPPKIRGSEKFGATNVEVVVGDTLDLECEVTRGTPKPEIEWWKRSRKIMASNRVKILGEGRYLRIPQARVDDYGVYTCVAKNSEGADSKAFNVQTLEPPKFSDDGTDEVDVVLGFSHYITCDIDAQPQPRLEWLKDGQPIVTDSNVRVGHNGRVLLIRSARLQDGGIYMCRAKNKAGSDDKLTKINILTPPLIYDGVGDNNIDVGLGGHTYLNCTVQGYPQPNITWFRNGIKVDLREGNFETYDDGQILSISTARLIDSGRYDCHASNTAGRDRKDFRVTVQVPPTISGPNFEDLTLLEGRYYELDCFSSGIPEPDNEWFKDSILVSKGQRYSQFRGGHTLGIYGANENDNGMFICEAENVAGTARKTFNVTVYMSPRLDDASKFKDLVVNKGEDVTLNCQSHTFPKPTVIWIKNGEEVSPRDYASSEGRRIQISRDGFLLKIFDAEAEDAAQYSCELANDAGSTSRNFHLTVNTPPEIEGPETVDIIKPIDSIISMDCSVQGSPTPEVQWLKDNVPARFSQRVRILPGQNTLRIDRAFESDMGVFSCIATNVAGLDKKNFNVDILVRPVIDKTVGKENIDAILGEEVIMACPIAASNPPATVTWHKDGLRVVAGQTQILESGQLLIMPAVELMDAGSYTCIAKNDVGQDDRSFELNILVPPAVGLRSSQNHVEVNETFDATLECDIIGGQPPPQITWTHNGEPLQMTQRVRTFAEGRRLEIHRALTSDTGNYKCTGTNTAGSVSDTVRLDVYVPPAFVNGEPQNIKLIEGKSLELDCSVDGVPDPELAWMKSVSGEEAYPLFEGERVRFAEYHQSASIAQVVLADTGLYSCIASSIAGQVQKLFNVTVQVPPSIDAPLDTQKVTVVEGRSFDLDCPVSGVPMPEVTWLKNGRPLPLLDASRIRNNGQQLHIQSAQLTDKGTYSCVANSEAGTDSRRFDVDVIVPPSALNDILEITAVTGNDVKLECKSDAIPPPSFSWFKEQRPIGHYGHLLLLKNVQVGDTGIYTCEARNDAGTAVQHTKLIVLKKPEISPSPQTVTALLHETVKLMCIVDGVPKPEVSWWKDSHELSPAPANQYKLIGDALEVRDLQLGDSGEYMCLATNDAGSDQQKTNLRVLDAPTIGRGETNITAIANQPVTLSCDASGTPQPVVRWTKDSRPYYTSHRLGYRQEEAGSMQISAVSVEDTGFYTCTAENEAGSADRDIQLFVQVPPSISSTVSKYIVEPFTRLRIPCDVSGVPMPTARWTREGIDADLLIGVYVNPRDNSLDIPSVGTLHEGVYTCMAENPAGQAHYDAEVRVRTPPVIANPKQTVVALEGSTTTLPCEASGTPEPFVKWRRGSQLIDTDEGRFSLDEDNSLRISNVEVDDAAGYTCVAQNIAGTAFGQVQLDVHVLPRIETILKPREVATAGQPFSFTISASGIPDPSVFWAKDGFALEGIGDSSHYLQQEDGSLHIPIVLPSDAGLYNVTATNAAGIRWLLVQLDVIVPPEIRAVSSNVTIVQGGQIPLDIVVDGDPAPTITWTKDGEPIDADDDRIRQLSYGSLIINNAMSTDSGYYVATGINSAGRDSAEIEVVVQVPPTFVETPREQQRLSGDDMSLRCAAVGHPVPVITWEFGDALIGGDNDGSGTSQLLITNMRGQDAGVYTCKATNPAGVIAAMALVSVDSPPVFTSEHDPSVIGRLGQTSRIDCPVAADPIPTLTWTKDGLKLIIGRRFQQLSNGSLLIHNAIEADAGDYRCIATNEAGSVARVTKLILEVGPRFLILPSDTTAISGSSVLLNCTAAGVPTPKIMWRRFARPIQLGGRFTVLRNNSLQIASVHLEDTGEFQCIATNDIGSRMAKAFLTVQVHGQYGNWGGFGPCTSTCGAGTQTRIRFCNFPPPANGGDDCVGPDEDTRPCLQGNCPVNGKWGEYGGWETCSVKCGQGTETRTRECNNPPAQFGGAPCSGKAFERRICLGPKCAVNGKWSSWGVWNPCTSTCGEGVSVRVRACNNPPPSVDGEKCPGSDTESRVCNLNPCPVRGNWGSWGPFSICSVSCGGGTRNRIRTCSDPLPSHGGELCPGSNVQQDNCNPEPCPVNGNWADWALWSSCSRTCGGGQRRRYRACSSPRPRYGGKYCPGTDTLMQSCGLVPCPEDGGWTEWTEWTPCGVTCGAGTKTRRRSCTNPSPRHNGKQCTGDNRQTDQCALQLCPGGPRHAIGTIFGNVNDIPISGSSVLSHGVPIGDDKTRITSVIKDIPKALGPDLRNQVSILTPIYWTFAREIDGAYNGHTLTGGNFERLVNVEFPSGELVEMHHNARGLDGDGNLLVDIEINGNVPMFPPTIKLNIMDYFEEYLQTGPQSLYAYSDRFYSIDDEIMLYTWNHSIFYEEDKVMPYLVEQMFGTNIIAEYDPETLELLFQIDVTIGKGDPSSECPYGFVLDDSGEYCNDENECETQQPCSDLCENLMGSYICNCPAGFHIGMDGNTCEDIDECEENESECDAPFICQNTRGTYKCILTCGPGLETTADGQACQDINECDSSGEKICEHICNNTYGSFRCTCRLGFQRIDDARCEDIDECSRGACGGDINQCHNTDGSYFCTNSCPAGFYLDLELEKCVDQDECLDVDLHHCEHKCENVDGSYRCVCFDGYKMDRNTGLCGDLDECADGRGPCQYACKNVDGSYKCYCPEGYRLTTNGHSCEDIDECREGDSKCIIGDVMCANTLGSYKCLNIRCPREYSIKNGVCTRDCLDDECPNKFKSIIRFNSTFLRVGVPKNQDLLELAVSYAAPTGTQLLHRNTRFRLLTPQYERAWRLFGLRVIDEERGIIYTKMAITRQFIDWYRLRVTATSETVDGTVQYETIFSLFINVAPNPFN